MSRVRMRILKMVGKRRRETKWTGGR